MSLACLPTSATLSHEGRVPKHIKYIQSLFGENASSTLSKFLHSLEILGVDDGAAVPNHLDGRDNSNSLLHDDSPILVRRDSHSFWS